MEQELVRIIFNALRESGRIQVYEPEGEQDYLDLTIDEPKFADHTEWRITLQDCS